jgi:hypothetical protein
MPQEMVVSQYFRVILSTMAATSTAQPIAAARIAFAALWANYPSSEPCINPATHHAAYEDQCSIKLGKALHAAGVNFKSFRAGQSASSPLRAAAWFSERKSLRIG